MPGTVAAQATATVSGCALDDGFRTIHLHNFRLAERLEEGNRQVHPPWARMLGACLRAMKVSPMSSLTKAHMTLLLVVAGLWRGSSKGHDVLPFLKVSVDRGRLEEEVGEKREDEVVRS